MKTTPARTRFPIPAFSAAFQRGLLLAAIIPPEPNGPASIPSSRSCCQPPLFEPAVHVQNDRIDRDKVGNGGASTKGMFAGSGIPPGGTNPMEEGLTMNLVGPSYRSAKRRSSAALPGSRARGAISKSWKLTVNRI